MAKSRDWAKARSRRFAAELQRQERNNTRLWSKAEYKPQALTERRERRWQEINDALAKHPRGELRLGNELKARTPSAAWRPSVSADTEEWAKRHQAKLAKRARIGQNKPKPQEVKPRDRVKLNSPPGSDWEVWIGADGVVETVPIGWPNHKAQKWEMPKP